MLVLVVPAILHLPAVEPLLHESVLFPGFSRAFLVAVPIAGLVLVNFATVVATRSLRSAVVAIAITTALAFVLVLGAAAAVEALDLGDGID